ncbi:MAG: hypothetical protein FWE22_00865 [Firmicutes bacterium]|nr:hypothetical protein [Bacillota bacterium]
MSDEKEDIVDIENEPMIENEEIVGDENDEKSIEQIDKKELFTKAVKGGMVEYIEREVDRFNFDGYEVVRRELFSKANCPAVTLKYGSVLFNVRAVRKFDECLFVQILVNKEAKRMIVKPCDEYAKEGIQWSRIDKREKIVSREIRAKGFTAQLFNDMGWSLNGTIKMLGTLLKCGDEKIFVFDLVNAEKYLRILSPTAENPNRYERVPFMPSHWENNYGDAYEKSLEPLVKTFEDIPEGFVKIVLPPISSKKSAKNDDNEQASMFESKEHEGENLAQEAQQENVEPSSIESKLVENTQEVKVDESE